MPMFSSAVMANNGNFSVYNKASGNVSGMKQGAKINWVQRAPDKTKSDLGKSGMSLFGANLDDGGNKFSNLVGMDIPGPSKVSFRYPTERGVQRTNCYPGKAEVGSLG